MTDDSTIQKLILPLATSLIASLTGWVINQLPPIKQSSGKKLVTIKFVIQISIFTFILSFTQNLIIAIQSSNESIRTLAYITLILVIIFTLQIIWDASYLIFWRSKSQMDIKLASHFQSIEYRLLQQVSSQVAKRLDDNLYDMKLIDISWLEKPEFVNRLPKKTLVPESREESIVDIFSLSIKWLRSKTEGKSEINPADKMIAIFSREDIDGKLLILGEPGSGKTTTLLLLAKELIENALKKSDSTEITNLPIVLELSDWKNNQLNIKDWITEQLNEKYHIAPTTSKEWLRKGVILPFLDGLDELGLERQVECVKQINQFLKNESYPHLVVCCRSQEFDQCKVSLDGLNNAICLQPLTDEQISSYLKTMNRSWLWDFIQTEASLKKLLESEKSSTLDHGETGLLRIPLFLKMVLIAYTKPDCSIKNRQELINAYIDQRLNPLTLKAERNQINTKKWAYPFEQEPEPENVRKYLNWLAESLSSSFQTEFLVRKIQPTWISSFFLRWVYRLIYGVTYGLAGSLLLLLIVDFHYALALGLLGGLMIAFFLGLYEIKPVESFEFSLSRDRLPVLWKEICTGSLVGLAFGLILSIAIDRISGLLIGLFGGFVYGLISGLRINFSISNIPRNEAHESLKNLLTIMVMGCCAGLLASLLAQLSQNQKIDPLIITKVGISMSLFLGTYFGGLLAYIQHFTLRIILWIYGYIPWNYTKFLDYSVERRLLQRVGKYYRFIHREVLDHFASQDV